MAYDISKLSKVADLKLLAQRLESDFAKKSTVSALSDRVDQLVTQGGEPNVINSISVNGTAAPIEEKGVNIVVPTAVSDLSNDSKFQTEEQVAATVNAKVSSTYKAGGSCAFADLLALEEGNLGLVCNVTDKFTTTEDFVEGAGSSYPAGTNVAIVKVGEEYKYDVLAGFVDLSSYETAEQTQAKLDKKVSVEEGKGLSTNDFTTELKTKLENVPEVATTEEITEMLNEVFGTPAAAGE